MAAAVRTSFSAAGTESGGGTYDSASVAVQTGDTVYVMFASSDGSPAAPTGVAWDPTGVAQSLTKIGDQPCGSFGRSTVWRGQSLTAKTAVFRATYSGGQGEQVAGGIICTGVDTVTPNGTVATGTANDTTAVTATASTSTGQLILGFAHYVDTSPSAYVFNSPSGSEAFEVATSPQGYDRIAGQSQTAAGASTNVTWTLSGADSAMDWRMFAIPINDATGGGTTDTAFSFVPAASLGYAGRGIFPAALSSVAAATLTAVGTSFKSWRVPTSAIAGTAVHVTVFSGASPTYAILAQGTAIVDSSGYASISGSGNSGDKALAFVHNYNDNTATSSIFGGAGIATVP